MLLSLLSHHLAYQANAKSCKMQKSSARPKFFHCKKILSILENNFDFDSINV